MSSLIGKVPAYFLSAFALFQIAGNIKSDLNKPQYTTPSFVSLNGLAAHHPVCGFSFSGEIVEVINEDWLKTS